jgi:hypothetical protein
MKAPHLSCMMRGEPPRAPRNPAWGDLQQA